MSSDGKIADVKPLHSGIASAAVVVDALHKDMNEIEDIFVVVFPKTGGHHIHASGHFIRMALAGAILNDFAVMIAKKEVVI